MNKKLILSLGTLASIAAPVATVISCGETQETTKNPTKRLSTSDTQTQVQTTTYSTKVESVLKNSNYKNDEHFDTSTVGQYETEGEIKHIVNVVDSVDFIQSADVMAVWDVNTSVIDKLEFVKDFQRVYVNDSDLIHFEFQNNSAGDWAIDEGGVITKIKANAETTLKVWCGKAEKTIRIVQRNQIKDQILPHFNEMATDSHISLSSPWGTTTTIAWGNHAAIENKPALKVSIKDKAEASGGAKAYAKISKINEMTNKITFDATANYVGFKVFIPENMINNNWWFRLYFRVETGPSKHSIPVIDMNEYANTITKAGWYTFCKPIDHSKFLAPIATLDTIKIIEMNGDKQADSGDVYVAGIYTSDEEITEIA